MKQPSNLLKRLFSKDPNIRYAKQIKKGKVKVVKLENMRWFERVKFVWRERQMRHVILPIILMLLAWLIFDQAHRHLEITNCDGVFGISKPVLSITNLVSLMVMMTASYISLYRYDVRLDKAEWRLKHWQDFKNHVIYQCKTPLRRKLTSLSFRTFLALMVLGFGSFAYLVIDAIIDYGGWTKMNRAMIEQCEGQAINQTKSSTP